MLFVELLIMFQLGERDLEDRQSQDTISWWVPRNELFWVLLDDEETESILP
jgi:hypothetical protein